MLAEQDYWQQMARRLEAAPRGGTEALVAEAQQLFGVSRNTFYVRVKQAGYSSGRKVRVDRGQTVITEDELQVVSKIMLQSNRANNKRLLSVADAMQLAHNTGALDRDISVSQMTRQLQARGLTTKQLKSQSPYQPLKSSYPNWAWEFDVSLCVLYYMQDDKLGLMAENEFYKNKPENFKRIENKRLLRYLITDHASGSFYLRYYLGSGETSEILFDFLMRAMHQRDQDGAMYGVPRLFVWDAGSANQSAVIKSLLTALDIRHYTHIPGNPRAKGQVECTHDLVERHFEGMLSCHQVSGLDDLNDRANNWRLHYCTHANLRRAGSPRYNLWQLITNEQLRICPDTAICQQLLRDKLDVRVVKGDLTIQYQVKGYPTYHYSVADVPDIRIGESVEVTVNPYQAPSLYVITPAGQYALTPIKTDQFGFYENAALIGEQYKSQPDTEIDTNRKAIEAKELETNPWAHIDPAQAAVMFAHHKQARTQSVNAPSIAGEQKLTTIEAYNYIKDNLTGSDEWNELQPHLYAWLKEYQFTYDQLSHIITNHLLLTEVSHLIREDPASNVMRLDFTRRRA